MENHRDLWEAIREMQGQLRELVGFVRAVKWMVGTGLRVSAVLVAAAGVVAAVVIPLLVT
jgi:hypothetical protein